MFVDKNTGKVKWLNIVLAKIGVVGSLALATYVGAHNSAFVKNAENMILHGPRIAADGFYRGDADIEVKVNRYGDIERYVKFVPSGYMYALGEDGFPKEPEYLMEGLENRLNKCGPGERRGIVEKIKAIEIRYSK